MNKRYIALILVILFVSTGVAFKILKTDDSPSNSENNTINQHENNNPTAESENETITEPENGTIVEPENETIIEPVFLPKFHIYGFEFYGIHSYNNGGTIGGSAYVSFFIQNLGNGTATVVLTIFNIDFAVNKQQHYFHATKIIDKLEPKETQHYEVDVDENAGFSHWNFNSATANISCAENVTEVFNFSNP